jgi:hypothetical protein
LDKATAKFAVIVDFPTPPFPDETAIILLMPGICFPLMVLASSFVGASTLRDQVSQISTVTEGIELLDRAIADQQVNKVEKREKISV